MARDALPTGPGQIGARYSVVAIALHWLIAAAILFQLVLGWRTADADGPLRSLILQWHKSIGLSILLLSLARLAWRLSHLPPPEVASLRPIERRASHWVQYGFYIAMIALPVTGWAMISGGSGGARIRLFGLLPWPRLPLLSLLPPELHDAVSEAFGTVHLALVWAMMAMLALHVVGAMKHQLLTRDAVLARMAPGAIPGRWREPRLAAIAFAAALAAGLAYAPSAPRVVPRPKVAQLAAADLYLDAVAPILSRRCASCHDDDRARGGFSVAGYPSLLDGGVHGPAVRPGAPARSELLRRISLPHDNPAFMPKDGRTPLSSDQTAVIGWWIAQGAPPRAPLSALTVPDTVRPALLRILGLASASTHNDAGAEQAQTEPLPAVPPADPQAVAALRARGFLIRPVTLDGHLVDVAVSPLKPLDDGALADLVRIAPQIHSLNLARAGVTDSQMVRIGAFPNVAQLELNETPVTDAGVARLTGLKHLVSINLWGTKVTRAGLVRLAGLPRLQRIYAWQSEVADGTQPAVAGLGAVTVFLAAKPVSGGSMVPTSPAQMQAMPPAGARK